MKPLPRAVALAVGVCLTAVPARADLPPSPYIHLLAPINGAVVPNTPGAKVTFSFSVNWVEINKKYKSWGGAKNLFMAIGMHADVSGAGIMMGDFITEGQSSKTWAVSDILAAMPKEKIPAGKPLFWNVIIRPHNTANPNTTDRTEDTFGIGPAAPAPAPVLAHAGSAMAGSTMPPVGVDPPGSRAVGTTSAISAAGASLKVKSKPKITLPGAIRVPGDKKTFTATVEVGNAPKAGLDVKFSIDGHGSIGHNATNAQGKASVSFTVPNNFKAQIYTVKAATAATSELLAAEASAEVNVIKGATMIELGDLIWGTYKGEPGSPTGSIIVKIRQSYGAKSSLEVPFKMTVNGNTWNISANILYMIPLPTNATTWVCSAEFLGNDSYTGSYATRTYKKP